MRLYIGVGGFITDCKLEPRHICVGARCERFMKCFEDKNPSKDGWIVVERDFISV